MNRAALSPAASWSGLGTRPEEVIPQKSDLYRVAQCRDARTFEHQVLNVVPFVFEISGRLSPTSGSKSGATCTAHACLGI